MGMLLKIYIQQAKHGDVAYNLYTAVKTLGGCLQFIYSRQNMGMLLTIYIQQSKHGDVA